MQFNRRNFISGALGAGVLSAVPSKAIAQDDSHNQLSSPADWLLDASPFKSQVTYQARGKEVVLSNGLLRRVFRLAPNAATVAVDNLMTGESVLRSVRPEAMLTVDDSALAVGGLLGQPVQNYFLHEWLDQMTAGPRDFQFLRLEEGKTQERFPWKRVSAWVTEELPWPPPGVSLTFHYGPGPQSPIKDVLVRVRYELYDGIPLMAKQIEVENNSSSSFILNSFHAEIFAIVESGTEKLSPESANNLFDKVLPIHVETDYDFGGGMNATQSNPAVRWVAGSVIR